MVKEPIFLLEANGKNVTNEVKKHLVSISFTDNAGVNSDTISIKVAGAFKRPKKDDELKLFLGYRNEELFLTGLFHVQSSVRKDNNILIINATGVDFSLKLKTKKSKTYERMSIADICSTIASEHSLKIKSDFNDIYMENILQTDESDLSFLNRLSNEFNAIFSIKNQTLIFLKRNSHNAINDNLPIFKIDATKVSSLSIKYSNKLLYKSCKVLWHDTKENKPKEIMIGKEEPTHIFRGTFKNEANAQLKANSELSIVNKGIITGSFKMDGMEIFAGANIELFNTINNEDDRLYSIKSAKHNFTQGGWIVDIDFNL